MMPLPYRILAVVFLAMALAAGSFGYGLKVGRDRAAAQQLAAERLAADQYRAEITRGNTLSAKLAVAESNIQIKTVERIKYVPQVTTGRECLSAGAVGLLNGSGKPTLRETTRQPAPTDAGELAATDTDVEDWAINASGRYETCATRLNELIDWDEGN